MRCLVCLLWCVLPLAVLGCAREAPNPLGAAAPLEKTEVALVPVMRQDLTANLELVGNFLPARRSVIVAEVDGVIETIPTPKVNPTVVEVEGIRETLPLDIGASVQKGDLLVQLDASDYELALEAERAKLAQAKADLAKLLSWKRPEEIALSKALYDEAQANFTRAESAFERSDRLLKTNATSTSEHEEKHANALKARALLAHAEANVAMAEAGPTAEEIAVAKAAVASAEAQVKQKQWRVDKTTITAPYGAVITDRYVDVGERVTALPRVEIMELMEVRFLVAEVGVPERFFGRLQLLDQAQVRVQGRSEPVPGLVVRINEKVDPGSRTFRVRIGIDNGDRQFHVGQFVRVLLNVASSPETLTIPLRAVTYSGGQPSVFVFADDKVSLRPIELGIETDDLVEVAAGLKEGDQVVVDDPAVLTDNMPVRVRGGTSVAQLPASQR